VCGRRWRAATGVTSEESDRCSSISGWRYAIVTVIVALKLSQRLWPKNAVKADREEGVAEGLEKRCGDERCR